MDFCARYSKVAWARPRQNDLDAVSDSGDIGRGRSRARANRVVLFTRLRCRQWDCDYCARQNQRIWRGFLHEKLPEIASDWWMVTLTASSLTRTTMESYKNLQAGIDVLMKRIRRHHGEIEYVRTFERHPSSEAIHAHFIICGLAPYVLTGAWPNHQPGYLAVIERPYRAGCWTVQTYLKKMAHEAGMGYMADGKPLSGPLAVNYVTKYLTKDLQGINIKGMRHVQTTRGIGSPAVESDYQWTVADYATAKDFQPGEAVQDLQTGQTVEADYWNEFNYYPPEMN